MLIIVKSPACAGDFIYEFVLRVLYAQYFCCTSSCFLNFFSCPQIEVLEKYIFAIKLKLYSASLQ